MQFQKTSPAHIICDIWERKRGSTHLTTPSPASCIKVDNGLLLSIGLCHLTSQIAVPSRKPDAITYLWFPSWSWNFCCRCYARLGFIFTFFGGNFTFLSKYFNKCFQPRNLLTFRGRPWPSWHCTRFPLFPEQSSIIHDKG